MIKELVYCAVSIALFGLSLAYFIINIKQFGIYIFIEKGFKILSIYYLFIFLASFLCSLYYLKIIL